MPSATTLITSTTTIAKTPTATTTPSLTALTNSIDNNAKIDELSQKSLRANTITRQTTEILVFILDLGVSLMIQSGSRIWLVYSIFSTGAMSYQKSSRQSVAVK